MMIQLLEGGTYLVNETELVEPAKAAAQGLPAPEEAAKQTMAYNILRDHNTSGNMEKLQIKFDKLTSHDITFVGIIQTARASGLEKFPVPYVLTNCHNSLCAVGGTINEDDHMFGLTCAKKYGGVYVPPHQAVIHQFAREMLAGGGKMILGSDSHTRYGALGTMAMGEGGPELVKQLLSKTYDINMPGVVGVYMTGAPIPGVGPQDVALAIIGAVFKNGFVKNKVMEFVGPGVSNLSADFRIGVDVMTTETTCLSSIWRTDDKIEEFYAIHGRSEDYKELNPGPVAYYDGMLVVELDKIRPMIAMPFHPSNTYTIDELNANLMDILDDVEKKAQISLDGKIDFTLKDKVHDGKLYVEQGIIAGCAGGGFENICAAADILKGASIGADAFTLSVYPASTPIYMELARNGRLADLMATGAIVKTAFCGPCFGASDAPGNNDFCIRHSTRNFPNREGSNPANGQIASVALMDSKSIAATAFNGGYLTSAEDCPVVYETPEYEFNEHIYENIVYNGFGKAKPETEIVYGPSIKDWPKMPALTENLLLQVASVIRDEVTTTDELIPSGETASYRSNPYKISEFTLIRKDPQYVGRAKAAQEFEKARVAGDKEKAGTFYQVLKAVGVDTPVEELMKTTGIGSVLYAKRPGDGSAREYAASCQKVLGGLANICIEYATKRYRSNCVNWGMLPFTYPDDNINLEVGEYVYLPGIRKAVEDGATRFEATIIGKDGSTRTMELQLNGVTEAEKKVLLAGSLINSYKAE
mgnify:CR=1 FL=1